ncbi:vanadium-dependent haloperoxidase [Arcticibacterium luteifluviistationis]|uniref:Phosphoesterase n=1 Tax=Arcticibacterium luteifluviistationis TaxID=1784714 RepID=A0A2Z4GDD4_9BACT|nr:vanadium-dependent haloperoxidase [Arcticibacterium luteifluviistationis]AWV99127.1 phosphoesterase [Arcticibacterium luteifluviistationis]
MKIKKSLIYLLGVLLVFSIYGCKEKIEEEEIIPEPEPVELSISPETALRWSDLTLQVIKNSPNNSPTYASRSLGYFGLTMYESTVKGSIIFKSITSDLTGLGATPAPEEGQEMNWEIALNAGQKEIINSIFPHAPIEIKEKIDSLYKLIKEEKLAQLVSQSTIDASDVYGKLVARQIFEWSKLDNGHEGFLKTFDFDYNYPTGRTYWSPPVAGQSSIAAPMHPYWGNNRTFAKANTDMEIPVFMESDNDPSSQYYKDMMLVYEINKNLTQEEKEIALWWGDDPAVSASPPGHSYYLTASLIKEKQNNLFEATSAFAKVGMSAADAFINVWKCKYFYHAERPKNFISRNIDGRFVQFWPEPPFPAFTSGHSSQIAATATAMIDVFGNETKIIDDFHTGRPWDSIRKVEFKTRTFDTIWELAEECGYSRILGGIHTPQDNTVGLDEGIKIGNNIIAFNWKY